MKVKVSKMRTKIKETRNSVLIPADPKVVNLTKAFKVMGNVSGLFEIPDSLSNVWIKDTQRATELDGRHGTELRLEML
jgi:hypothetical protein